VDRVRGIEILLSAAEAGSFARAAKLLQLDPSAVSHAIAQLERELKVTLFYRTTRQLRLTEDGAEIVRRGKSILRDIGELVDVGARVRERVAGTLRIGMHVPISHSIIMPRLPVFMRRYPDLKVECRVLNQVKDFHAAGLDILLRVGEPPESDLVAWKLGGLEMGLYAAPSYLASAGIPKTPEELVDHRCLIHHPPTMDKPWDRWVFEREGLIAAARAGGGLMRIGMFDPHLIASGSLQRVLADWRCPGGPQVYAIYRKSGRVSKKIAAFRDFAGEAIADFDPEEITMARARSVSDILVRRPRR
jgi:DNA-binding transcriptional LysR family regulator